jgi:hypothetical protein
VEAPRALCFRLSLPAWGRLDELEAAGFALEMRGTGALEPAWRPSLQPQPTTPTDAETAFIGSLKDRYYFHGGALLETGFGVDQYSVALTPRGTVRTS